MFDSDLEYKFKVYFRLFPCIYREGNGYVEFDLEMEKKNGVNRGLTDGLLIF